MLVASFDDVYEDCCGLAKYEAAVPVWINVASVLADTRASSRAIRKVPLTLISYKTC